VFIDMAGARDVRVAIHEHYADRLAASIAIGSTHWKAIGSAKGLPGPAPAFFFAPQFAKTLVDRWGAPVLRDRVAENWSAFTSRVREGWIRIVHGQGQDAILKVYDDTVAGRVPPDQGHILSP
jgi:hypothetical protein